MLDLSRLEAVLSEIEAHPQDDLAGLLRLTGISVDHFANLVMTCPEEEQQALATAVLADRLIPSYLKRTIRNWGDLPRAEKINTVRCVYAAVAAASSVDANAEDSQRGVASNTAVINLSGIRSEILAEAYFNRGTHWFNSTPPAFEEAIRNWTFVVDMQHAPSSIRADALFNRGIAYETCDFLEGELAIADYIAAIKEPGASDDTKASAYINHAAVCQQLVPPQTKEAIKDLDFAIALPDVPSELRAGAFLARGLAFSTLEPPCIGRAIADCRSASMIPKAPSDLRYAAHLATGVLLADLGNTEAAILELGTILEAQDASDDQKAKAFLHRGTFYQYLGSPDYTSALADFTAVIEMANVDVDLRAFAWLKRIATQFYIAGYGVDKAINDLLTVKEIWENCSDIRLKVKLGESILAISKMESPGRLRMGYPPEILSVMETRGIRIGEAKKSGGETGGQPTQKTLDSAENH